MKRIYAREDGSLTYEERLSCLGYTYGRDVVTNATRAAEGRDIEALAYCSRCRETFDDVGRYPTSALHNAYAFLGLMAVRSHRSK